MYMPLCRECYNEKSYQQQKMQLYSGQKNSVSVSHSSGSTGVNDDSVDMGIDSKPACEGDGPNSHLQSTMSKSNSGGVDQANLKKNFQILDFDKNENQMTEHEPLRGLKLN